MSDNTELNDVRDLLLKVTKNPNNGFIMQKDLYTTNLIYENTQFPFNLRKNPIPFRVSINTLERCSQLNDYLTILHKNGKITKNSDDKEKFYSICSYKPKHLRKYKLKFPLPVINTPLLNKNFNTEKNETSYKNNNIQSMDDDLNITSIKGKKIYYQITRKNDPSYSINHSLFCKTNENTNQFDIQLKRKKGNSRGYNSPNIKDIISELNRNLKDVRQAEIDRKKSFVKEKFFSTQVGYSN